MKILFVHQNFPAQFKNLAPALVKRGDNVVALSMRKNAPNEWQGIKMVTYLPNRTNSNSTHPWVIDFESKVIRGEACYFAAKNLFLNGFRPDLVIAHPGWGESMFLKEVWPNAKLGIYCEFFYQHTGADFLFDPEFQNPNNSNHCRLRLKNANNLMHFEIADAGISPTNWQASTFPTHFKKKISVIHDGIDTDLVSPRNDAVFELEDGSILTKQDEVITFINRNLEPYRGYHIFMRSLPELLNSRPNAKVLIVGGDSVSYGFNSPTGRSWKDIFVDEIKNEMSDEFWSRVLFLGLLDYSNFIKLLQISTVHVYLTYPFVLSWSLLEAMSAGCAIVASDTTPVTEVIKNNETGLLFNFFEPQSLVESVLKMLNDPALRKKLSVAARDMIRKNFDLKNICLPQQLNWIDNISHS